MLRSISAARRCDLPDAVAKHVPLHDKFAARYSPLSTPDTILSFSIYDSRKHAKAGTRMHLSVLPNVHNHGPVIMYYIWSSIAELVSLLVLETPVVFYSCVCFIDF